MAKELKPEQNPVPAPDASEVQEPPKSYRLYIALAFVALILFQAIILAVALRAWFPPQVRVPGGLNAVNGAGMGLDGVDLVPPDLVKREDEIEIEINEGRAFRVKKTTVDDQLETFSVVMHVAVRTREKRKFDPRYEARKNTINDQIESMLDASSTDDRKEVGLTAIKAKAKKIINDELGVPFVQRVLLTDKVHELQ